MYVHVYIYDLVRITYILTYVGTCAGGGGQRLGAGVAVEARGPHHRRPLRRRPDEPAALHQEQKHWRVSACFMLACVHVSVDRDAHAYVFTASSYDNDLYTTLCRYWDMVWNIPGSDQRGLLNTYVATIKFA